MRKIWEQDEIDFMSAALVKGWTHKEIGNELDRTKSSVECKASKLGIKSSNNKLKTTTEYKKELPSDIEVLEEYINALTSIKHKHKCGHTWSARPADILFGKNCPKCYGNILKTTEEYKTQLPKDIDVLEPYINYKTKIIHRHNCGHTWKITPSDIIRGRSCPACCICAFKNDKPAVTYLIYFPEYDLYKFGISNRYKDRFKDLGSTPKIIFIREFDLGLEARELERIWSKNVERYKINTGLLKSGNTETFKYKA